MSVGNKVRQSGTKMKQKIKNIVIVDKFRKGDITEPLCLDCSRG